MTPPQQSCWHTDDVSTVTTKQLTTTGGTVWNAARVCCSYLEAVADQLGLARPGVRVLELGSGCGWLGLVVARNAPEAAEVCLTEQAYGGALEHLRRNVAANPGLRHVTCRAFDWTHAEKPAIVAAAAAAAAAASTAAAAGNGSAACKDQQQQGQQRQHQQQEQQQQALCGPAAAARAGPDGKQQQQQQQQQPEEQQPEGPSKQELLDLHALLTTSWELIIGSDLVYNSAGAHALPRVLATLMPPRDSTGAQAQAPRRPVAYYAHTKHRYDHLDELLFANLAAEGLSVEEVVEPGKELPPASPPLFSSLFPDMRCAVFRICR